MIGIFYWLACGVPGYFIMMHCFQRGHSREFNQMMRWKDRSNAALAIILGPLGTVTAMIFWVLN